MFLFFVLPLLIIAAVVTFVPRTVLHGVRLRLWLSSVVQFIHNMQIHPIVEKKYCELLAQVPKLLAAVKLPKVGRASQAESDDKPMPPDLAVLNCRVRLTDREKDDSVEHLFSLEVCGSIRAPENAKQVILRVAVDDIADGPQRPMPIQAALKQHRDPDSGEFLFTSSMGRLPERVTVMNDWTAVAQIPIDWLVLPRRAGRKLIFEVSLLAGPTEPPFATAHYTLYFENYAMGYLDLAETTHRTKTLAVPLVFAFCADSNDAVEIVKQWARRNVDFGLDSPRIRKKIDKALEKSADFFRNGNLLDTERLCTELADVAHIAQRYEILDLCLNAAQARGSLADEDLTRLQNMARWLGVDPERFRSMLENTIPLDMRKDADTNKLLGITPEMDEQDARRQLNRQFRKWHSRVTNADPEIRAQADHMLNLIAEARSQTLCAAACTTSEPAGDLPPGE